MIGLLLSFFVSFIATLSIIHSKHLHAEFTSDWKTSGPQKFHEKIVPRIGGISIAIGVFAAIIINLMAPTGSLLGIYLLISAIPVFFIGLTEDITKQISVKKRLMMTIIGSGLAIHLLNLQLNRLDIPVLDLFIYLPFISAPFIIIAICGLANAYNIIDGFNGLSSMVGVLTLLALAYVGFRFSEYEIVYLSLSMAAAILGFFVWNYPRGLIFLGDGGAYLIGFWIAVLSIMLCQRHENISPWFALQINAYPIIETLFTIYRRKMNKNKSASQADGIHFHSLVYRRILKNSNTNDLNNLISINSRTAPYLWCLCLIAITPAILFYSSTKLLVICFAAYTTFYIWLYVRIIRFKTPHWF
jgi:UDP-N-acetylmuramyl pentapeptide phosphotransferase/UDP-N-acetylglucosamine-1-phosphate transferase